MSTGELSAESIAYLEEKHIKPLLEELFHDVLLNLPEDPLLFLLNNLDKKTTLRLMLVGPSGCGKRTQSRRIAEKYGAVHINADDIFRAEVEKKTEYGEKIDKCIKEGIPLPNDVAANLIIKRLGEEDVASRGWILDGFPRTRSEALQLQAAGISPILFILLDVPTEVSVKRCSGRRYDPITQNIYHLEFAPPPRGMQVELMSPDDESVEVVVRRWKYFNARRDELIECYEPFYICVNGNRAVDEVFEEISEQIDSRFVSV